MTGRLDPLDALLGGLLALGVLIAGTLAVLGRPVPELVELVTVACLGAIGVRRRERDHAT